MNARRRVGVLTFHRCINYGSYWQARALVEALQARGFDAVLLDYHSHRVNRAEWKCAIQPTLPTPVPRADRALYRRKIDAFFDAFAQLPLSKPFDVDDPRGMDEFDAVVVGSDEVWNFSHPWFGNHPTFFGAGLRAERLVSYAASFGSYGFEWGMEERWKPLLRRFHQISVRDENSRMLIEQQLGFSPETVLDPCLTFPFSTAETARDRGDYVAVYGHNFSPRFVQNVQKWAREQNLPLISVGYRNDWADENWLTAGPLDFVPFIERARALATNFFHGCVFALRSRRPFVCETTPYRFTKVANLMKTVGGEAHLAHEASPFETYALRLNEPISREIASQIEQLRAESQAFLERALN